MFVFRMPAHLSMEEGAAVQPLAIAIHACNRAAVRLGARVAIFGAGPVGVLCAMAARAMGAHKILITDITNSRLETAKALGADYTLLVSKQLSRSRLQTGLLSSWAADPTSASTPVPSRKPPGLL
ncbi:hypothetical protein MSG28_015469 [Choristoneura fumiferana]|uniref:Uncharacterized protein n=1 Tax=Choristoneura fumiferana TaxID=7141 RepID=A0ACC0KB56_CHOFU|nr:hypothetical protein MSG28_015469 [Choristoneura fumiferana]